MSALQVKVSIAQPFVVAGEPFTLTTSFTNNHDGPIEVVHLVYHVPHQVQWVHENQYTKRFSEIQALSFPKRWLCRAPWRTAASAPGQAMIWGNLASGFEVAVVKLLPGETGNYSFSAIARKWLFTSGGDLIFPGIVKYRYRREVHHHEFDVRFKLRPPLRANCIGAIAGAFFGPIARELRASGLVTASWSFAAGMVLTGILALVAVIYSSRKTSEAQPIVTVEDFWGGFLVGFLMGFVGNELFGKLVPMSSEH